MNQNTAKCFMCFTGHQKKAKDQWPKRPEFHNSPDPSYAFRDTEKSPGFQSNSEVFFAKHPKVGSITIRNGRAAERRKSVNCLLWKASMGMVSKSSGDWQGWESVTDKWIFVVDLSWKGILHISIYIYIYSNTYIYHCIPDISMWKWQNKKALITCGFWTCCQSPWSSTKAARNKYPTTKTTTSPKYVLWINM